MVSYVILGSHANFNEAMTKINKILPEAFGSIVKLTKGHVVSRKWLALLLTSLVAENAMARKLSSGDQEKC